MLSDLRGESYSKQLERERKMERCREEGRGKERKRKLKKGKIICCKDMLLHPHTHSVSELVLLVKGVF